MTALPHLPADPAADPLAVERRRLLAALELERARGCPERRPYPGR